MPTGTEFVPTFAISQTCREWLAVPALLLASTLLLSMFYVYKTWPQNYLSGGPQALNWSGASLVLSKGQGYERHGVLEIVKTTEEGIAIASLSPKPFRARDYSAVTWSIEGSSPETQFAFLWRTVESPGKVFTSKAIPAKDGSASWTLADTEDWVGNIMGLALLVKGDIKAPVSVKEVSARPVSIRDAFDKLFRGWMAPQKWETTSINFLDEKALDQDISLTFAIACIVFLAAVLYVGMVRIGILQGSVLALSCIVFCGWLALDARWQWSLFRQLDETKQQFAGKSLDDKHLAIDGMLADFMQQAKLKIVSRSARILYLSDDAYSTGKGRYYLYPQNVLASSNSAVVQRSRSGDYVIVFAKKGASYDNDKRALTWEGASSKPAELLYADSGNFLVRIR